MCFIKMIPSGLSNLHIQFKWALQSFFKILIAKQFIPQKQSEGIHKQNMYLHYEKARFIFSKCH